MRSIVSGIFLFIFLLSPGTAGQKDSDVILEDVWLPLNVSFFSEFFDLAFYFWSMWCWVIKQQTTEDELKNWKWLGEQWKAHWEDVRFVGSTLLWLVLYLHFISLAFQKTTQDDVMQTWAPIRIWQDNYCTTAVGFYASTLWQKWPEPLDLVLQYCI